jgi:hypothetical protein
MMARRFIAPILGALTVWALAAPQPVRAQDSYVLKRVYKAGEKDRYRTTITVEGQNPSGDGSAVKIDIALVTTETTQEIKPDGTITLVTTVVDGTINANGQERPFPGAGETITTTLDKNGKPIKVEGGQGQLAPLLNMTRFNAGGLQDRALKVGQDYKFEIPTGEDKNRKTTGVITLSGKEPKCDEVPVETLKVKGTVDTLLPLQQEDTPAHIVATAFVEPGTGKTLKIEGTITGKLGLLGDVKLTFKRLRVNPDEKK